MAQHVDLWVPDHPEGVALSDELYSWLGETCPSQGNTRADCVSQWGCQSQSALGTVQIQNQTVDPSHALEQCYNRISHPAVNLNLTL